MSKMIWASVAHRLGARLRLVYLASQHGKADDDPPLAFRRHIGIGARGLAFRFNIHTIGARCRLHENPRTVARHLHNRAILAAEGQVYIPQILATPAHNFDLEGIGGPGGVWRAFRLAPVQTATTSAIRTGISGFRVVNSCAAADDVTAMHIESATGPMERISIPPRSGTPF